ncbi:MAG: sigma-54-dependent Fis family transcriptional regulator [Deltaproteobacteria bacterium]|nr:sigma-54-dependent Fis family transcriptional regulator [Deltaproteobacteria bacterium]
MGSAPETVDSVLVVDDDLAIGTVLVALLEQRGYGALHVATAEEAVRVLDTRPFDIVLSDIRMPGMDGMALLDHVTARFPGLPVVLLTAHGSVTLAVDAMKRGAADFVQKPFERDEIAFVVEKALTASRRARSAVPPMPAPLASVEGKSFVGESAPMREVFATIRKVAAGNSTVLVRGETGTGKELVARALHEASPRKDQPFVTVHCAALPETLLESELFGYERGAFTGATQRKPGRIELAHKGTLFLDEIGDVPKAMQVKLLRVLQERELERVGGTQTIRVDVRVVAATHRDLEAMIATGEFREDLFYRLAVVPLTIPPLRERQDDIARLVRHFVSELARSVPRPGARIDDDAVGLLAVQSWPGNVRQLQNFVERLVVLADDDVVRRADVEREIARSPSSKAREGHAPSGAPSDQAPSSSRPHDQLSLDARRKETEREALVRALAQAGNNRTRAARLLEVSRRTLYNKLREHGLE